MHTYSAEKKTFIVIILTLITMVAEIFFGYITHSMALFADGWHMGTHALALTLTFMTYVLIRKFSNSKSFAFGTGKFGTLAGYTSSILLGLTGIFIIYESAERLFNPLSIGFNEAIIVAIIGLIVNSVCILIMGEHSHGGHSHHHHHDEHCHHEHGHGEDYNFKAAYMHILADAMTSVCAIVALFAAKYLGWTFLDPVVGFAGGVVICVWAYGLIKSTSLILLDAEDKTLRTEIIEHLSSKIEVNSLHVWKTSDDGVSVIVKVKDADVSDVKAEIRKIVKADRIIVEKI